MSSITLSPARRQLLAGTAAAVVIAGFAPFPRSAFAQALPAAPAAKPLPGYASWKSADGMIVHSANTLETRRGALGTSVVTPSDRLFVRNNLPPPNLSILDDRDAWKVSVEGVGKSRSLTVAEMKTMGVETTAMVLQCSGNGRGFFQHKASGTQWLVGAAGCVIWSGVPVRTVVEALGGVADGMKYMTGTGGEVLPEGLDPKSIIVERSVPTEAMADALLAWEMNGEPIPLANGGPLRLIVPGYTGVNNIKYIKRLAFTPVETEAAIMATGYRLRPIGVKGNPSQPSAQEMPVKSWIDSPLPDDREVKAGRVQIQGVAFGGVNAVERVEVSVDGGKRWENARFVGPDLGKYAWRVFVLPADLSAGEHVLVSRATDTAGNVQPEQRYENERGYNNNSWADHAVKVKLS